MKKYGDHFTYNKTARAQIFRRDVNAKVVDEASFVAMMRYNDFENDVFGTQGCTGGARSASNAISERGDLSAPDPACSAAIGVALQNEAGIGE